MNRHMIISIAIMVITIAAPLTGYAATLQRMTLGFGGKVVTARLPGVTCAGIGTGPVVLLNNVKSLANTVIPSQNGGEQVETRVGNTIGNIYGAIPFYAPTNFTAGGSAIFTTPAPKTGDWILGRAQIVPNLSRCTIGTIPFPVRETSTYNVSR